MYLLYKVATQVFYKPVTETIKLGMLGTATLFRWTFFQHIQAQHEGARGAWLGQREYSYMLG